MIKTVKSPKEICDLPVVKAVQKIKQQIGQPRSIKIVEYDSIQYGEVYLWFEESPMKCRELQTFLYTEIENLKTQFPEHKFSIFCGPVNEERIGIAIRKINGSDLI